METEHVLTVNCAESPGIVHAITGFLLDHDCDIIDTKHFGDRQAQQFFMRVHFAVRRQGLQHRGAAPGLRARWPASGP